MSTYRTQPLDRWVVEAQVRGPLNSFLMGAVVEALNEGHAIEQFEKTMTEGGFTILSEVKAYRA
jgi:hypothetical protein